MASVTGTGISTPPAQLVNTVQAIVQKYIAPVLGDQVLTPSPTMWALIRRGKKMAGGALVYPEFFSEETTGGAYYGAQLLNTALQDVVQPAEQQWRFYYEAVVLPYTDIILGRGGYAGVDIVRQKFQTAAGSFMQKLSPRPVAYLSSEYFARHRRHRLLDWADHQHHRGHQPLDSGQHLLAAASERIGRKREPQHGERRFRLLVNRVRLRRT